MPKTTITLWLALISICSFAQKPGSGSNKPISKKLLPNMSFIQAKSFNSLVYTGSDTTIKYHPRIATVSAFYITKTEVTNKEYRDFVFFVRDSIAHELLQHYRKEDNHIDWDQDINWNDNRLDAMMTPPDDRIYGRKDIDPSKLLFTIDFFGQKETITVCPDTLVWIRDFSYSYNEPLVKRYFAHQAYDKYPVIGVSLKQAMAFCEWKTKELNAAVTVRLPSNAEWEAAAIGDKVGVIGFNAGKSCNCNFETNKEKAGIPSKGFKDDGSFYTMQVKSFSPRGYGLYDMQGNVAEWTSTAIDEIMNVEVKAGKEKRKFIVKGGGWNSTPFYLQPGVCQFYEADAANCWTGFRYVAVIKEK